jgi:fucose permease
MNGFSRGTVWFNRLILAAATLVMTMIAVRNLHDPIGATLPLDIALRSPSAVTVMRVGFGGFPLGFAVALCGCLVSTRRLLTGLALLAAVIGAAIVARVQGLLLDGVTPYNLRLLRPEVAMLTLSAIGIALERRRRRGERARAILRGPDAAVSQ